MKDGSLIGSFSTGEVARKLEDEMQGNDEDAVEVVDYESKVY